MLPDMRRVLALLFCAACGAHAGDGLPEALRGLPPRQDPTIDLNDEDDLGRARADYDAMLIGDAQRSAKRRELWAAYRQRIERVPLDTAAVAAYPERPERERSERPERFERSERPAS